MSPFAHFLQSLSHLLNNLSPDFLLYLWFKTLSYAPPPQKKIIIITSKVYTIKFWRWNHQVIHSNPLKITLSTVNWITCGFPRRSCNRGDTKVPLKRTWHQPTKILQCLDMDHLWSSCLTQEWNIFPYQDKPAKHRKSKILYFITDKK